VFGDPIPDTSDIHGKLHTFKLGGAPPFAALSYTWGDPALTSTIYLDGQPFLVRPNLHAALVILRMRLLLDYHTHNKDDRLQFLWIDAICIDQENIQERSHQVNMMSSIYSSAFLVVVWLGELDETFGSLLNRSLSWRGESLTESRRRFQDMSY
jgi:Heterokaryon incompatibility protein (HET)